MKRQCQKLTAVLLTALILTAMLITMPVTAAAAEAPAEAVGARTGQCKWYLDSDGTLTIRGQGAMADYNSYYSPAPWGTDIKKVIIEDGVINIGNFAFAGCYRLSGVSIPNSVTTIGDYAFYQTNLSSIVIPESVTHIDDSAFSYCTGLKSVSLGSGVTGFNHNWFYGCNNITEITVSPDNLTYDSRSACNAVIETATNTLLLPCKKTVIPDSVTSIGDYAFEDCSGLNSISLPDSVTSISNHAFDECSGLKSIKFSNSLTTIGDEAFFGCSGLTNIKLPNGVTSIGELAFGSCENLTKITIPASVETIGKAFIPYYEGWYPENEEDIDQYGYYLSTFAGCSEDLTICGYAGTCAEAYAKEFYIRFFDLNTVGDVDGKAGITINDVTAIQKHLADLSTLEGDALMAADTNGDGVVNIDDATRLQMYLAEYDVVLG